MTKAKANAKTKAAEMIQVTVDGKKIEVPSDAAMRADDMSTLSARIRHLAGLNVPTAEIRKIVRRANGEEPLYQHVRNVLNTPLKRQAS